MDCLEKIKEEYDYISIKGKDKINFNDKYEIDLRESEEVKTILEEININSIDNILKFGSASSKSVTEISDGLLYSLKNYYEIDINEVLNKLDKVINEFDFDELKESKKSNFFKQIFKKNKYKLDKQISKYTVIVDEVDKSYFILKKYEITLSDQLKKMNMLYESNFEYCSNLENYIAASGIILENLDKELSLEVEKTQSYEKVGFLKENKEILEQRIYDLKITRNVSLQNIALMEQIQNYNFDLINLIKSSLIITLPIFKRCLTNSIILKKQEILSIGINNVQKSTNKFFMKNKVRTSKNNLKIIENQTDLYSLYKKIMCGIEECKKIKEESKTNIEDGFFKLEDLKEKMKFQ